MNSHFIEWETFKNKLSKSERRRLQFKFGEKLNSAIITVVTKILKCSKCQCIAIRDTYEIDSFVDTFSYQKTHRCTVCKSSIKSKDVAHDIKSLKCAKCEKPTLTLNEIGIWD
jgi:hypothetical protein